NWWSSCAARLRSCAPRWRQPSTRPRPARSLTRARKRSATSLPISARPPSRLLCNSVSTPRKRLFPPPQHPHTQRPLQNKGLEEHTLLTINGRITLWRRRYAALDLGSHFPLDPWIDRLEDTVSLGLRELACRLNLAARDFDKAA